MKNLVLSINEEETLKELLDEEIEETNNLGDDKLEYINHLKFIRNKLKDNTLNEQVRLGLKVGQLKNTYQFKSIYEFILGKEKECYYFVELKPLYDEFGYQAVNDVILAVGKEIYEVKKDE